DHPGKVRPCEPDARDVARAVDRVGRSKRLLVEPFGPGGRIIVDPDCRFASPHIDMIDEREVAEAEIPGDVAQGLAQLLFAVELANIPDKRIYTIEHPPLRLRRGTVFQVTSVPQRPFS